MTQNTADRLYLLLVDRLRVIGGTRHAAEDIAAEIDRLAAERDEAQRLIGIYGTSRDAVIAQLGTEIDRLTAERDGLKAALAASWPNLSAQLSEARAEVERLRPAAEAWEASRFYSDLMSMDAADPTADGYWPVTDDEIIAASDASQKADARARAAKERKP